MAQLLADPATARGEEVVAALAILLEALALKRHCTEGHIHLEFFRSAKLSEKLSDTRFTEARLHPRLSKATRPSAHGWA
jgi:hypothetical protein